MAWRKKIKSNYHFLTLMIPKLTISLYSGVEFLSVCQGKYALGTCEVCGTSRMLRFKCYFLVICNPHTSYVKKESWIWKMYLKIQELQQRIQRVIDKCGPKGNLPSEADYKEEMAKIRKDIVDFHGEMVLLVNYSNVNYTGTKSG